MIIDCHTHWGLDWENDSPGNPDKWLGFCDRHQVDSCFLMAYQGIYRLDLCRRDNDLLASMAGRYPKRLMAVGSAWPQMGKEAVAEARRCMEQLRVHGMKFHPWLQGFSTANPYLDEISVMAAENAVPLFFHDGTPCYSLTEQIVGLARRFPKTQIVLAHAGMLWNWRSALHAVKLPNVWFTLCGPHLRTLEILAERGPRERLIWGSDFGAGLADQIEYRLNLIRRAKMPKPLLDQILGPNAQRLAGLRTAAREAR